MGGSSGDRGHMEVPSSSTAEPRNEGADGTRATFSSPPKKRRTEPDASPAFQSGVHCSGGPQSGSAARSCARGNDWHEDSGRLERAGPLHLPVGAVRVTRLPVVERLPTYAFYVPVRQSWRRVEDAPRHMFVPHMGDRVGSFADAASAALQDRWVGRDDRDGSDASEDGTGGHPADYFHLSSRTRRAATRRGICSVVKTVGDGTAVVDALATLLDSNAANVRRTISLIERRARDNETAREEQASTRTRRESFEELTGGVSLAVVLGSGAPLSVSRQPSGTHPVADFSGSRLSLCTSVPVLGAPAVHRARACHNAAVDSAAAGIGPSSRAWAVLQAGAVVAACEEGFRLRADASLLRELRSALRSPGVGAVAAEASLGGSLLDVVARHLSTGTPISAPIVPPRTDTTVLERDTFSRLLCRVCLRYTCRLHGLPCRERLPTTPGVVPVHLPPDPNVLSSLQAHARTSGAGHPVAGQEGNSPPAGQGAAVSAQVDVGVSLPSQSAVRRARLAGAIHGAIGVAASACPDCVLYPRRHLRGTAEGDDGWTADQVAFLRAGCGIVGEHDSCRLAAFVPGQTCRTVAAYIAAVGLPEERRRFVSPPLEDAPETDSLCRTTSTPTLLSQAASSQRPRQQGATLSLSPSGVTE